MKRIAILYGGKSGEHEVSLRSAASIARNLDAAFFEPVLIGITKDGVWMLQDKKAAGLDAGGAKSQAENKASGDAALCINQGPRVFAAPGRGLVVEGPRGLEDLDCDLGFPVLHGSFGEDGTIQGLLETADLAYIGAPVLGSALGMDKEKAKRLWLGADLPVVPFVCLRKSAFESMRDEGPKIEAFVRKLEARFDWPLFVKPASAGSSVGTAKAASAQELLAALAEALVWDQKALIEPFIDGREIECSVLGNEEPQAFPPGEIISSHEFYDYDAKYTDPEGARLVIPAALRPSEAEQVKKIAVAAYEACEIQGMARVDFFIVKQTGEILLNELNTIPGFTSISMYPKMCEAGGLPYPALITRLAELALERREKRRKLKFSK